MKVITFEIPGLLLIEPKIFKDPRGWFCETFHIQRYLESGITEQFVQDNYSCSVRGTLRGLHYQEPHAQGKLVMVVDGRVYDVVVDIRRGSPTFGTWQGIELSADNFQQLYVPPGCAHGFCVTSEKAAFLYKCTDFYSPKNERGIIWNDPTLAISWPITVPILSVKDQAFPTFQSVQTELPQYRSVATG